MSDEAKFFPRIEGTALRREDDRGYLEILYESPTAVLKRSFTRKGCFRGLHWQDETAPQVKIFRIVSGAIADFAVPMDDPAKPIHYSIVRPEDGWIRVDANLAHGLYAIEDAIFEYFCDGGYDEASEKAFSITDHIKKVLGVDEVILSPKDQAAAPLEAVREGAR
ncbi:MAG TPA: dTDP-4-dehydrorhamnose 3,5-epimerase family protein [Allosphingosinicella sp.]|uniref:dTDP-4-dehydrorhamnose 3,5-epimerase family protein n=1 Tax=Allosphingosinicella sp. TaxID=2823234 RepID=UPI002ED9E8E0